MAVSPGPVAARLERRGNTIGALTPLALALVLASAGLHAGWNLFVKRDSDPVIAGWRTVVAGALVSAPALLLTGPPPVQVWTLIALSSAIHTLYGLSLATAYRHGDLSVVYPIARGLAPLLTTAGAAILLGELLPLASWLLIALISAGLAAIGLSAARGSVAGAAALPWSGLTAITIASYTVLDKHAVQDVNPLAYGIALFIGNSVLYTLLLAWRRGPRALITAWNGRALDGIAGGLMSVGAYALVLAAFQLGAAGYVAALRESSILISLALGRYRLGDDVKILRGAASVAVTAGLVLLGVLAVR